MQYNYLLFKAVHELMWYDVCVRKEQNGYQYNRS